MRGQSRNESHASKTRKIGETQWGTFAESAERNHHDPDSNSLQIPPAPDKQLRYSDTLDMNSNENNLPEKEFLTPYLEIRERLNRGMYELAFDKPCVRSSLNTRDGQIVPAIMPAGCPTRIKDNGGFLGTRQEEKAEWARTPWALSPEPPTTWSNTGAAPGKDPMLDPLRRRRDLKPWAAGAPSAVRARRAHERRGRFELDYPKPCVGRPDPARADWTPPSTAGALSYNNGERHLNTRQVLFTRRGRRTLEAEGLLPPAAAADGKSAGRPGVSGGGGRPTAVNSNFKSTRGRLSREIYGDLGGDELGLASLSPRLR